MSILLQRAKFVGYIARAVIDACRHQRTHGDHEDTGLCHAYRLYTVCHGDWSLMYDAQVGCSRRARTISDGISDAVVSWATANKLDHCFPIEGRGRTLRAPSEYYTRGKWAGKRGRQRVGMSLSLSWAVLRGKHDAIVIQVGRG